MKRYEPKPDDFKNGHGMEECDGGDWVAYEDVLAMRDAIIEECARVADRPKWTKPEKGDEWWAYDTECSQAVRIAAAIRKLKGQS